MKKILTLLFISFAAIVSSQNLANGLQACYPMDNNVKNYAPAGVVLDGVLINVTPTTGHTGVSNAAYSLNGTVGSYIELPDHPGLKSNSVFFSGWFRIDALPTSNGFPDLEYLVYTSNGCVSHFEAYSLHIHFDSSVNDYVFVVTKAASDCMTKPQIFSLISPTAGNWYHVCFYIDNSVMKLYVNGVFQASKNVSMPFGYMTGKKVYLGVTNESNFNKPFKGAIDNVRFYNRELTQQEVTDLYTQDPACAESLPESAFSASQKQVCKGASITFTDQSTNVPTSWNWQFQGGTPGSSVLKNPTISFPNPGTYTVSLVASNVGGVGNTSVQTITVSSCTAITENSVLVSQVSIYPNPAADRVYVEGLGENTLFVCDLLGKPVKYIKNQVAENVLEVNLQDVVSGIYLVQIVNSQGSCLRNIKLVLAE